MALARGIADVELVAHRIISLAADPNRRGAVLHLDLRQSISSGPSGPTAAGASGAPKETTLDRLGGSNEPKPPQAPQSPARLATKARRALLKTIIRIISQRSATQNFDRL
jgi:hypothetical protein